MQWKPDDIPGLLLHLPEAVQDLIRNEDPKLVEAGKAALKPVQTQNVPRHYIIGLQPIAAGVLPKKKNEDDAPEVSIEKSLDPFVERDSQNMELLLHDYLFHLPDYQPENHEGEKLLEHWRKILQDQPRRLAVAKSSYWNTPEAREFWKDRLMRYRTDYGIPADFFPEWEDWQKAAGAEKQTLNPARLSAQKAKQWQDLVIRSRLHQETKAREMEW